MCPSWCPSRPLLQPLSHQVLFVEKFTFSVKSLLNSASLHETDQTDSKVSCFCDVLLCPLLQPLLLSHLNYTLAGPWCWPNPRTNWGTISIVFTLVDIQPLNPHTSQALLIFSWSEINNLVTAQCRCIPWLQGQTQMVVMNLYCKAASVVSDDLNRWHNRTYSSKGVNGDRLSGGDRGGHTHTIQETRFVSRLNMTCHFLNLRTLFWGQKTTKHNRSFSETQPHYFCG